MNEALRDSPSGRTLGWVVALIPLALTVWFAAQIPVIAGGMTERVAFDWVPGLDARLSFHLDGLSLLFALLISGIGTFIFLYSAAYLAGHRQLGRFYLYLLLFMLAMLGLVLADNLVTLFVFWELTTITSFLLIGFEHDKPEARRNALQALLVTGTGGLVMLAGFILMAIAGGSWELSELVLRGDALREHPLYLPILLLVLVGAFTKSAQFPFHFWLPNAMAAPTPVSAYLHSATMVKAGIYLLARVHPALGGTEPWMWLLMIAGAITAVWASLLAVRQNDLKLILAYTTLMALGTLTMFLGAEVKIGITAAITFLVAHSLYKAALFMVVGSVDHEAGSRELDRLGGLGRAMPITAVAAAAAAFSMAGFPPFLGFIGKELKYEGALAIGNAPYLVAAAALTANALMTAVAAMVAVLPFWTRRVATPLTPHEAPWRMWLGPLVLATLGLAFGMAPGFAATALIEPAVSAVLNRPETVYLSLWHGINVPLAMSVATLALGLLLFRWRRPARRAIAAVAAALPSADRLYDGVLDGLMAVASWQTRLLQNGLMRRYMLVVFATLLAGVGATLLVKGGLVAPAGWPVTNFYVWGVALLIAVATGVTVVARSRIMAICALGVVGAGIALMFMINGAPDVAMTQLMIETLTVVLIALVLPHLPGFRQRTHPPGRRAGRVRDAVLAIGIGGLVTAMLLAVTAGPLDRSLTAWFEERALPEGQGHNIVNVILVDFRALDTLGEIAVVAIAGFACYGLIKLRRAARSE